MTSSLPGSPDCGGKTGDIEAVQHLKAAVADGRDWYVSLLEAIGLWCSPEDVYRGRRYKYLIGGEAFDWLLLAERLVGEVREMVPEDQVADLLFSGKPPSELSKDEFKRLIGAIKYKAHLNYVYGVVLEEALLVAVEEEVYKEMSVGGFLGGDASEEAFIRVYGTPRSEVLAQFKEERSMPPGDTMTLADMHEFTYWLFKFRMSTCDPERVASDTRKAMNQLWKAGGRSLYV
ncbi:MAG: hypothetical protein HYX87_07955 [Chloroflexi bacterium]|nr:hypothetical protein [Chloroflexota bacterium]